MSDLLLEARGISKHFGGIDALSEVDLEIRPGEVMALMGENGAGKSTMAKIVAGIERPDSGTLRWDGSQVAFRDTRDAARAGIAIVLQELSLVPDLSVAENIFLGRQDAYRRGWWLDRRGINRAVSELTARLGWDLPIDPERKVGDLTVAEQQMVEILRALAFDARLVILDEPTATLSPHEVDILFSLVRRLRAQGTAFLIVTHRLEEVFALADRITVYRDGKPSGVFETARTNQAALIRAMVGRDLGDLFQIRTRREPGESILTVRRLAHRRHAPQTSFTVRRGEIVAIAGLVGAGRSELVRAIFGAEVHADANGQWGRYVRAGGGQRSLGTIQAARVRALRYQHYPERGRWDYRLRFVDTSGEEFQLAVVDLDFRRRLDALRDGGISPDRVATTTLTALQAQTVYLRIGLARGWEKHPDRCYLQITGVYGFDASR